MNIFILDLDVAKCAEYHTNSHILKMAVETSQLLSTAHRLLDGEQYVGVSKSGRKAKGGN